MRIHKYFGSALAGICAGAVNGLFGGGGGMVLVPLLIWLTKLDDDEVFPASVSIILPICLVSLCFADQWESLQRSTVIAYLISSAAGGVLAGLLGKKIPTIWLHRILGLLILWGGVRYLC